MEAPESLRLQREGSPTICEGSEVCRLPFSQVMQMAHVTKETACILIKTLVWLPPAIPPFPSHFSLTKIKVYWLQAYCCPSRVEKHVKKTASYLWRVILTKPLCLRLWRSLLIYLQDVLTGVRILPHCQCLYVLSVENKGKHTYAKLLNLK